MNTSDLNALSLLVSLRSNYDSNSPIGKKFDIVIESILDKLADSVPRSK